MAVSRISLAQRVGDVHDLVGLGQDLRRSPRCDDCRAQGTLSLCHVIRVGDRHALESAPPS